MSRVRASTNRTLGFDSAPAAARRRRLRFDTSSQSLVFELELFDARVLLEGHRVERLDRRKRDSVRVDRIVRTVGAPEPERGLKILRHRSEVTHVWIVHFVRPGRHRHPRERFEYVAIGDRDDARLGVSVAHALR